MSINKNNLDKYQHAGQLLGFGAHISSGSSDRHKFTVSAKRGTKKTAVAETTAENF
ncbi:MAG: hypothetical protein RR410_06870 [Alistipes sp.]